MMSDRRWREPCFSRGRAGWTNPPRAHRLERRARTASCTTAARLVAESAARSLADASPARATLPGTGPARARWPRRSSGRSYRGSRRRRRARAALPPAPASRASRSRISRKRLSMLTEIPFSINCLCRRRARSSGAGGDEHLERGVREHDGAHVAAVGDQPRRAAEGPLALEQRRADRRVDGHPRRGGADRPRRGSPRSTSSPSSRIGAAVEARRRAPRRAAPARAASSSVDARRAAPAAPPAGTARRCRGSGSRAPGRRRAATVPLPDAAGPSTAITGTVRPVSPRRASRRG